MSGSHLWWFSRVLQAAGGRSSPSATWLGERASVLLFHSFLFVHRESALWQTSALPWAGLWPMLSYWSVVLPCLCVPPSARYNKCLGVRWSLWMWQHTDCNPYDASRDEIPRLSQSFWGILPSTSCSWTHRRLRLVLRSVNGICSALLGKWAMPRGLHQTSLMNGVPGKKWLELALKEQEQRGSSIRAEWWYQ